MLIFTVFYFFFLNYDSISQKRQLWSHIWELRKIFINCIYMSFNAFLPITTNALVRIKNEGVQSHIICCPRLSLQEINTNIKCNIEYRMYGEKKKMLFYISNVKNNKDKKNT